MRSNRFDVLERFVPLFEAPEPSFEGFLRRRARKRRNQRIVAGVVGIALFVAPVALLAGLISSDRTQTPAGTGSTVPRGVIGLPPVGATPSTPERGELVLHLEGSSMIWVYSDGRMIWEKDADLPEANQGATGFLERRLTPEGVELLRLEIISTGLFDHDLALARGRNEPFLEIQVRNGDGLVRVTWAWRGNYKIPPGAPIATPEQASALERLNARLADPASWLPASAWENRGIREYVPSKYWICARGIPEPIELSRVLTLLPEPARDLLRTGVATQEPRMPSNGSCSQVTTEEARALVEILNDAGIERNRPLWGKVSLLYQLAHPGDLGSWVYIHFGPVLPHGEATWLGPG